MSNGGNLESSSVSLHVYMRVKRDDDGGVVKAENGNRLCCWRGWGRIRKSEMSLRKGGLGVVVP